jgi:Mitochondrial ribosomal protein (VAR1)
MNNILKTEKKNVEYSKSTEVLYTPIILKNNIKTKKIGSNEPLIFKKKKSPIKTLRYIKNDTGKMKHFTPGAQEWFNSIYSYNENYTKLLPIADKNLFNLLKSYFNLLTSHKILKTKRIANRYRKLSANKVFVGKGELKHTNEKVIITSYVYNTEQLYLKSLTKKLAKSLYYPNKDLKKYVNIDRNGKEIITYNRPFTLKEYLNLPDHTTWHKNFCFSLFWKEYIKLIGMKKLKDEEKKEKKLKGENKNLIKFIDKTKIRFLEAFSQYIYNETTFQDLFNPLLKFVEKKENMKKLLKFEVQVIKNKLFFDDFDKYMFMAKNHYLKTFKRFNFLLMVNNIKFEKPFIWELTRLVKNIYNKEVEFNIVNLNKMHLNSDIYTQAVSLKLRNRDNKLFKVLTSSLSKVKLPNISRISEKYNKSNRDEYLINKIRNAYINSMFKDNTSVDPLNNLLLGFFSTTENLEIELKKRSSIIKRPISLYKYVIRSLKHLKLAGIRIEAKGRLTRRFTASKSVFKVRWKGGLKNVDSSFKGLSAIMLRGDRKSNVQYSILSSKNRNGAFGVKGWVSSK